jgi:hypothetical protein
LADRRKNGRIDLEAVEMLVRESMPVPGATALSHLLHQDPPESPAIPCSCGHSARYTELRSKPVLTVVGPVEYQRPYYICSQCHHAPNPISPATCARPDASGGGNWRSVFQAPASLRIGGARSSLASAVRGKMPPRGHPGRAESRLWFRQISACHGKMLQIKNRRFASKFFNLHLNSTFLLKKEPPHAAYGCIIF